MTGLACSTTTELWKGVIKAFLAGREVPCGLAPWANAYQGSGSGAVEWDATPEPHLGSLEQPRGVYLILNPGRADLCFQGRDGIFAHEISEDYGSYAAWAPSWPYLRDPWITKNGRNRHHEARLRFLRDWCGDPLNMAA